jgi:hypothetical protein
MRKGHSQRAAGAGFHTQGFGPTSGWDQQMVTMLRKFMLAMFAVALSGAAQAMAAPECKTGVYGAANGAALFIPRYDPPPAGLFYAFVDGRPGKLSEKDTARTDGDGFVNWHGHVPRNPDAFPFRRPHIERNADRAGKRIVQDTARRVRARIGKDRLGRQKRDALYVRGTRHFALHRQPCG